MKKTLYEHPVFFPLILIAIAALLLYTLSSGTLEDASANAQAEHLQSLRTLLPGSETFTLEAYSGEDPGILSIHKGETGYVVETAAQGYVDEIKVLVGVHADGYVTGLVVQDLNETFGLGRRALTDWRFLAQFLKTEGDAQIGTNVDALTGATVTSKAIARCVNSAVGYVTGTDAVSGATTWGG